MNIELLYQETIQKLRDNRRPLHKILPEQFDFFIQKINQNPPLETNELKKILCILAHSYSLYPPLVELIERELNKEHANDIYIALLHVSLAQIVPLKEREGITPSPLFFNALKNLLQKNDDEIVYWCLNIIEAMGPEAKKLVKTLNQIRPKSLFTYGKMKQENKKLIQIILKKWDEGYAE